MATISNQGPKLRVRRSFRELEIEHYASRKAGKKEVTELEKVVLAWQGIQKKLPTDPDSFYVIAGYHGEPFRGAGWGNSQWWGGYCNHGNILFPTWHRAYLKRLEDAMRTVKGCEDVSLPFWDECEPASLQLGIPETFGQRKFILSDGTPIDNPLFSYKFQHAIFDNVSPLVPGAPNPDYTKPYNYETVRYPLSGLVGPADIDATKAHNEKYPDDAENFAYLNENVVNWLGKEIIVGGKPIPTGTHKKFERCLETPYYTPFSNTTSAAEYNQQNLVTGSDDPGRSTQQATVPLESPHNSMHLAVGGFSYPQLGDFDAIPGANGDMGENNTASFDPIFYFHHCYIDRIFWLWQKRHNQTTELVIEPQFQKYPGTNSVDNQGPTPGVPANIWLDLDSPLDPFGLTSKDVVDIEKLGYDYGRGSFDVDDNAPMLGAPTPDAAPVAMVSGVNRASISGSFVVAVHAKMPDGSREVIGVEPVLSRWQVAGCANCQAHLGVRTFVSLHNGATEPEARVITRRTPFNSGQALTPSTTLGSIRP